MTERLPPPDPTRFPRLAPGDVRELPAGQLLGRIHGQTGRHPSGWNEFRRYGPTTARFDHHVPPPRLHPDRGVLYAVPALPGRGHGQVPVLQVCIAECYRERGVVELRRDDPYFALFRLTGPLRLLDLSDSTWVSRAGGNAAISAGPRTVARDWARAIHARYTGAHGVDGLLYASSTVPAARAVALWEEARDRLPDRPLAHLPLASPALRAELEVYARELHLGLVA